MTTSYVDEQNDLIPEGDLVQIAFTCPIIGYRGLVGFCKQDSGMSTMVTICTPNPDLMELPSLEDISVMKQDVCHLGEPFFKPN